MMVGLSWKVSIDTLLLSLWMVGVAGAPDQQPVLSDAPPPSTVAFNLPLYHRDDPSFLMRKQMAGMLTVGQQAERARKNRREVIAKRLRRDVARVESIQRRMIRAFMGRGEFKEDEEAEKQATAANGGGGNSPAWVVDMDIGANVSEPVSTGMIDGSGEFFTTMGVGYDEFLLAIDTGSDLIWLQCLPCFSCYQQSGPMFNPAASPTFRPVGCAASEGCSETDIMTCSGGGLCIYQQSYGDGSFTAGTVARDNFYVGGGGQRASSMIQASVLMGCGHDNEGLFVGEAGLLGLGRGTLSFASQVASRTGGVFSYCLPSWNAASMGSLTFGPPTPSSSSAADGAGRVYSPLLTNPQRDLATFYYVQLVGVSVDGQPVAGVRATDLALRPSGRGGLIVDSGTTVSRLVTAFYYPLRNAFREASRRRGHLLPRVYSVFDTCYSPPPAIALPANFPSLQLQFEGMASMTLPPENVMFDVGDENFPLLCFAFAPTSTDFSILGNIQQQGFLMTFDTQASRLGFQSNQCST
ncbi:hypothetical protein KP509_10G010900 [Ceratopteris richardii]|uniref:Peptidase A1 domain-containing protein n=1 Tax=Ceratopteris richardii TaxID=49495 RepID=A0A8T2TYC7_CERRI|nr:hypothetical protein KP509_10G010900 [Ceratopteris richardii]